MVFGTVGSLCLPRVSSQPVKQTKSASGRQQTHVLVCESAGTLCCFRFSTVSRIEVRKSVEVDIHCPHTCEDFHKLQPAMLKFAVSGKLHPPRIVFFIIVVP